MSLQQFGVIFDTHIIIQLLSYEITEIIPMLVDEDWFMLLCDEIEQEYERQVNRLIVSGHTILKHFLDVLRSKSKLEREIQPPTLNSLRIESRKDQIHVDCAVNSNRKAWVIVTNDTNDFQWICEEPSIPIIVDWNTFNTPTLRQNILAECRRHTFYPSVN